MILPVRLQGTNTSINHYCYTKILLQEYLKVKWKDTRERLHTLFYNILAECQQSLTGAFHSLDEAIPHMSWRFPTSSHRLSLLKKLDKT